MTREILPGIHWIQELGPRRDGIARDALRRKKAWYPEGRSVHIPQNAYLVEGERTLLFDTLSPAAREQVLEDVDRVLAGRPLDHLVVSHPDVPHAGNTLPLLERHPEARLVAPAGGETHALYHLDGARKVAPGERIDLGGRVVRFLEATFLDAALHTWMWEEATGTLFPVDWMGLPLLDGEGLRFLDELESLVDLERWVEFHGRVLFWFQYVDVARTVAAAEAVEALAPAHLAPAHGPVVRGSDVARVFAWMKEVIGHVSDEGRIGVL